MKKQKYGRRNCRERCGDLESSAVNQNRCRQLAGFFFSSRRRHTRWPRDRSSDVCSSDLGARLGVEAAASLGWHRWVGDSGDVLCLDQFGASAPGATALKELGFNVDNVLARARARLGT